MLEHANMQDVKKRVVKSGIHDWGSLLQFYWFANFFLLFHQRATFFTLVFWFFRILKIFLFTSFIPHC